MPIPQWKLNQMAQAERDAMDARYGVSDKYREAMAYGSRPRDWSEQDIDYMASQMVQGDERFMSPYERHQNNLLRDSYRGMYSDERDYDRMVPHSIGPTEYPSRAEAFLFGYDPENEEEDFLSPKTLGYMVPGLGEYLYGSDVAGRVGRGGMPGFVETAAFGVPIAKAATRRAFRAGKGLLNAQRTSDARRAAQGQYERMMRSRSLNAPTKRVYDVNSRKYMDINPYTEEVPYEEVRF